MDTRTSKRFALETAQITGCTTKNPRSKSRAGCGTCKQKRVKCDETKPVCLNCVSRKLNCPGYQKSYKWDHKWQTDVRKLSQKQQRKPLSCDTKTTNRPAQFELDTHYGSGQLAQDPDSNAFRRDCPVEDDNSVADCGLPEDNVLSLDWACLDWSENDVFATDTQSRAVCNTFATLESISSTYMDPDPFLLSSLDLTQTTPDCTVPSPMAVTEDAITAQSFSPPQSYTLAPPYAVSARRPQTRELLRRLYGMQASVPLPLVHKPTKLVEYYFSNICGLYSCFDSPLNPFRAAVGQRWSHSASLYFAIQSMAAAHLANELAYMRKQGLELHQKASRVLEQELRECYSGDLESDQPLLTLLLLGLSACWHEPKDLGLPYLTTARSLVHGYLGRHGISEFATIYSLYQMFEEAMIYWEMVISFVRNEFDVRNVQLELGAQQFSPRWQTETLDPTQSTLTGYSMDILPHPWTGVSPRSQMLLAEVGRLIRRVRVGEMTKNVTAAHYLDLALELEAQILSTTPPSMSAITNPGDPVTCEHDFASLAQATRDCGLLGLYRVFPNLLHKRLGAQTNMNRGDGSELSLRIMLRSWLTSFAIRILQNLEAIPTCSNVHFHQLLLLMIAAAELRLPMCGHKRSDELAEQAMEVCRARGFTRAKLAQLAIKLPARPVHVMLKLIAEVWNRMDLSSSDPMDDTFWMDVMDEKGWHTIMG